MTARGTPLRAVILAAAIVGAAFAPGAAACAQEVPPTMPADTPRVPLPALPPDTPRVPPPVDPVDPAEPVDAPDPAPAEPAAAEPARDEPPGPAPNFPLLPAPRAEGFATAVWSWEPDEFARYHGLSILELLDGVPGLVVTREGGFGRPAGIAAFGAGGGRLRVFVDGWELPPLAAGIFDVQRLPLVDVEAVRVTRTLAETRVEVRTFRLDDTRAYAQIEGADGDFGTRILRGLFARPLGSSVQMQAGLDVAETAGFARADEFGANSYFARLVFAPRADRALQAEYRRTAIFSLSRRPEVPRGFEEYDRVEAVVRGRARLAGPLWVDGALGRSRVEPAEADTAIAAAESGQGMLRALLELPGGALLAGIRVHGGGEGGWAPSGNEVFVRGEADPAPAVAVWGEARATRWGGVAGTEGEAGVRLRPLPGLSLFGVAGAGSRGVRFQRDTVVERLPIAGIADPGAWEPIPVTLTHVRTVDAPLRGLRAGADLAWGRLRLGGAFVVHDLETVVPYGLPFDHRAEPVQPGAVRGVETHFSLPMLWPQLRLYGWYAEWFDHAERPYLPRRHGHAALEFHGIFREGNLEPTIRLEVDARDRTPGYGGAGGTPVVLMEPYALFNVYAQVRILDVRIFYRFDNLVDRRTAEDVPGLALPGGRGMFGVRWFFRD